MHSYVAGHMAHLMGRRKCTPGRRDKKIGRIHETRMTFPGVFAFEIFFPIKHISIVLNSANRMVNCGTLSTLDCTCKRHAVPLSTNARTHAA